MQKYRFHLTAIKRFALFCQNRFKMFHYVMLEKFFGILYVTIMQGIPIAGSILKKNKTQKDFIRSVCIASTIT